MKIRVFTKWFFVEIIRNKKITGRYHIISALSVAAEMTQAAINIHTAGTTVLNKKENNMRDLSNLSLPETVQAVRELLIDSGLSIGERVGVLTALLEEEREELRETENSQGHWELTTR